MVIGMTVVYLIDSERVLLGLKKNRLGQGYYNGFGGHIEKGETPFECALREFKDESGLELLDLKQAGRALIANDDSLDLILLYFFTASKWQGQMLEESDEMRPKWFGKNQIPYNQMWLSDRVLLPLLLQGEKFIAGVSYRQKRKIMSITYSLLVQSPKVNDLEQ